MKKRQTLDRKNAAWAGRLERKQSTKLFQHYKHDSFLKYFSFLKTVFTKSCCQAVTEYIEVTNSSLLTRLAISPRREVWLPPLWRPKYSRWLCTDSWVLSSPVDSSTYSSTIACVQVLPRSVIIHPLSSSCHNPQNPYIFSSTERDSGI